MSEQNASLDEVRASFRASRDEYLTVLEVVMAGATEAEKRAEIERTITAMAGILDLSTETMVASCMRWFGMDRRKAEAHVAAWVEQRDRDRGRREAKTLRDSEGL